METDTELLPSTDEILYQPQPSPKRFKNSWVLMTALYFHEVYANEIELCCEIHESRKTHIQDHRVLESAPLLYFPLMGQ